MNGLRKFVVATLVLASPTLTLAQQPATISGRVTAETGGPLAGASVFLGGDPSARPPTRRGATPSRFPEPG